MTLGRRRAFALWRWRLSPVASPRCIGLCCVVTPPPAAGTLAFVSSSVAQVFIAFVEPRGALVSASV